MRDGGEGKIEGWRRRRRRYVDGVEYVIPPDRCRLTWSGGCCSSTRSVTGGCREFFLRGKAANTRQCCIVKQAPQNMPFEGGNATIVRHSHLGKHQTPPPPPTVTFLKTSTTLFPCPKKSTHLLALPLESDTRQRHRPLCMGLPHHATCTITIATAGTTTTTPTTTTTATAAESLQINNDGDAVFVHRDRSPSGCRHPRRSSGVCVNLALERQRRPGGRRLPAVGSVAGRELEHAEAPSAHTGSGEGGREARFWVAVSEWRGGGWLRRGGGGGDGGGRRWGWGGRWRGERGGGGTGGGVALSLLGVLHIYVCVYFVSTSELLWRKRDVLNPQFYD